MDEATRLLGATCDTFIKTLDDCMKLAANGIYEMPIGNEVILPPITIKKVWVFLFYHSFNVIAAILPVLSRFLSDQIPEKHEANVGWVTVHRCYCVQFKWFYLK